MIQQKQGEVGFVRAIKDFYKGIVDFRGRTTRAGYWWVQLAMFIPAMLITVGLLSSFQTFLYSGYDGGNLLSLIIWIVLLFGAIILPSIALMVRRLRDAGLTGMGILVIYLLYIALSAVSGEVTNGDAVVNYRSDNFFAALIGMFLYVIPFLATDTLTTNSLNGFMTFFFRKKELPSVTSKDDEESETVDVKEVSEDTVEEIVEEDADEDSAIEVKEDMVNVKEESESVNQEDESTEEIDK